MDQAPINVASSIQIAEALLAIVPYARMQGCQSVSICPTRTHNVKTRQKWPKGQYPAHCWPGQASQKVQERVQGYPQEASGHKEEAKKLLTFNNKNSLTKEFLKIKNKLAEGKSSNASLDLSDSDDLESETDILSISDDSTDDDEWDWGEEPQGINQGGQEPPKRINLIDKLISKSLLNDDLINDVHNKEQKLQSKKGKEKSILIPCPIISVDIRNGKKAHEIHVAGLSCLWDAGASDSMVKKSFVRMSNKWQYDTVSGTYTSNYDVKITLKSILWCLSFRHQRSLTNDSTLIMRKKKWISDTIWSSGETLWQSSVFL